jgi:hypothetical protein
VLSDVPKTLVYKIAAEINAERPVIPQSTLTKPPSAELRPDQKDQDSLPPYDVLDAILEAHVERGLDSEALHKEGFDPAVVADVMRLMRQSEYKRRQLPPGLKITGKGLWHRPPLPDCAGVSRVVCSGLSESSGSGRAMKKLHTPARAVVLLAARLESQRREVLHAKPSRHRRPFRCYRSSGLWLQLRS